MKNFDTFGVMLDCSRNAVMTVPMLKKFISVLAKMGYNQVQLYTEDTYEVNGEPFFGYFRGRYSVAELKEVDDFAAGLGVELVPCVQTLAHLNAAVRWPRYGGLTDCDDILLVGDDKTYELIDRMISTLRSAFRTKRIHIGMDEAHNLGKGRYRDLHGDRDRSEILLEHLDRVCTICDKYGFEPMMWSDMFYRIAAGGNYYAKNVKFGGDIRRKIPQKLSLVYWDYYHTKKSEYASFIAGHKRLTDRVVFAGGAWKWVGFAPHNEFTFRAAKAGINACIEGGVRQAFITMWGDDGAEASAWSLLPSLCYAACVAEGINDPKAIRARFKEVTGYDFETFMLLDLPDKPMPSWGVINPCKFMLYNDCFFGILDSACGKDYGKKYASFARRLANGAKKAGEYAYLFDNLSALCKVLSYKAEIGNRTRAVYASHNRDDLKALIADYSKMIKATETFYNTMRTQWYTESKANGFEVQDIRIGGLICRMKDCRDRLKDYYDGKLASIPELDEQPLEYLSPASCYNSWRLSVTTNVL